MNYVRQIYRVQNLCQNYDFFLKRFRKIMKKLLLAPLCLSVDLTISPHRKTRLPYLPTPWSRVLLEKLTGSAASQEIPRIFGTREFITLLTSARHLSLS